MTYTLGPANSVSNGAGLMPSDLLLLRIPEVGEYLGQGTVTGSSPLPSSSSGSQHFAFIRAVNFRREGLVIQAYPLVSFSREGGAINGYNAASDTIRQSLIPLPPLSRRFPTPGLFGPPLVIRGWEHSKDAWLHIVPKVFILPKSRSFKRFSPPVMMTYEEMVQIDKYRNALAAGADPNLGGVLGTGSLNLLSCCNRQADEPHDDQSSTSDFDDEEEDNFATLKDDLVLLASTDPLFVPELQKYLEAERAERTERVERWLNDVVLEES